MSRLPEVGGASTALLTDHYELTMLEAALRSGVASHPATFEVFTRRLPPGRTHGVFAGLGRLLDALERFRFGAPELAWLSEQRVVGAGTLDWLASYRFSGDVHAYREGELYTAGSPVLTVEGSFGEAVLLETVALSILNHDSAIAAAAELIVRAAGDRPVIEMGSRRTDTGAAVAAARAAYLAGFAATSNLEAGRRWGVPTAGTSAHAFTLAHDSERDAFAAQVAALGPETTLLVDTFDTEAGIRSAVEVGGKGLGAVRIDSGDLAREAGSARRLLDELGNTGTRVVVTGDLDDRSIAALASAPIDGYGVGTCLVTGLGQPTAGFVYKLVAVGGAAGAQHPVAKRSPGKATVGGRKWAWRVRLPDVPDRSERPVPGGERPVPGGERPVPGGDGPVPGGERPVPGGDGPVPGGDRAVRGGDGAVRGGDGAVRGGDGAVRGGDGAVRGGDGAVRGGDGAVRGGDGAVRGGDGPVLADVVGGRPGPAPEGGRPLQVQVVAAGEVGPQPSMAELRRAHRAASAELPPGEALVMVRRPERPEVVTPGA